MADENLVLPGPLQLALAVVILESKPVDVSVRDYMQTLRGHIVKTSLDPPYLDSIRLWKTRCAELQDQNSRLLEEVAQLRSQSEELPEQLRGRKNGNSKRKGTTSCLEPSGKSSKRSKRIDSRIAAPSAGSTGGPESADAVDDALTQTQYGMRLTALLFRLQRLWSHTRTSCDDTDVSLHITGACNTLILILEGFRSDKHPDDASSIALAIGRSIRTLLCTIKRLEADLNITDNDRSVLVYAVVSLLEKVLECIAFASSQCARSEQIGTERRTSSGRSAWSTGTSKLLVDLLSGLCQTDALSPDSGIHRDIYEGLAYLVLQRAGTCLASLTFGRRTDDNGQAFASIEGATEQVEQAALSEEAKHLGQLVERIVQASPAYLSPPDGPKLGRGKSVKANSRLGTAKCGPQLSLHPLIQNKLQRTLKDCMFPSGQGEYEEFIDRLRLPRKIVLKEQRRTATERKAMEGDTLNWFTEKMWSIVGWQILQQED